MDADSVRCWNCGKRMPEDARICPACGFDQPSVRRRIRCNYCGRRVPAASKRCPYCLHNPRKFYLKPRHFVFAAAFVALVTVTYLFLLLAARVTNAALALLPHPSPTATATSVAARAGLIVITETPGPTAVPTFLPTQEPSPTIDRTVAETPTLIPTATPTRAPTKAPTRSATRLPAAPAATASPTSVSIPVPLLVSPRDGEAMGGPRRGILLVFRTANELKDDQWFRVQVDFADRMGKPFTWCGWSRNGSIVFPGDYYDDSSPLNRTFRWHVNSVIADVAPPGSCAVPITASSPPSAVWSFIWN